MTSQTERVARTFPELGFTVDESVTRIRDHSLALDRCKRYTEIPRLLFESNLKPIEWAVFSYYYSLAPSDHPSELSASTHLKIGRKTLASTLKSLATKGMVFFDTYVRSKMKIVHIAHPEFWHQGSQKISNAMWTNPTTHSPREVITLPERVNDARVLWPVPGSHVRLPYLLFQTLIHPSSKYLYGLFCYLGVYTHPTVKQLGAFLQCAAPTVSSHIAELEEYRMIYSETREATTFGEHTQYYYHLTDVALWKSRKAEIWYPGGENSLIARLNRKGTADRQEQYLDEVEQFRPQPDTSRIVPWIELRQETSGVRQETPGVRQETSGVRQETSGVRQETSQIRRDEEVDEELRQTTSERRQETSQIRQEELRQVTSQIRQITPQIRQITPQIRQIKSGLIEKTASNPCGEQSVEETDFAKNTFIRDTEYKNTDRNYARERWSPVPASFHPRLINIAQSAAIAWRDRDYKFDRSLWNGAVEQIALEGGETEAVRFAAYVKEAHRAYGREFPYSPLLMHDFLEAFRSGQSWSVVLGSGFEHFGNTEASQAGENQNALPEYQTQPLIASNLLNEALPVFETEMHLEANPEPLEKGPWLRAGSNPVEEGEQSAPVPETPPEFSEVRTTAATPGSTKPIQLTHANLLDFPARRETHRAAGDSDGQQRPVKEHAAIQRTPRRLQLEKAIGVLTFEMKIQSRESLKRGFAKLDDDALDESLCRMFGMERIRSLVAM